VSSLHSLLDVMDLARLQAGHEQRQVKSFDAAVVLREFCERMQPLAEERGLYLKAEGQPHYWSKATLSKRSASPRIC
jgi:hypothetical protein